MERNILLQAQHLPGGDELHRRQGIPPIVQNGNSHPRFSRRSIFCWVCFQQTCLRADCQLNYYRDSFGISVTANFKISISNHFKCLLSTETLLVQSFYWVTSTKLCIEQIDFGYHLSAGTSGHRDRCLHFEIPGKLYANHPWSMIDRVLSQLHQQSVQEVVLVAPVWKSQAWYPTLLQMLVRVPLLIP